MRFRFNEPERLTISDLESNPDTVQLEIPTPETAIYPQEAIAFAVEQYATRGQQRYDDVRVVAGELLANAALHGNDRSPAKHIWTYCLWRHGFYVAVRDEGPGFDIENPPFVPGKSGTPPEGGLGIDCARDKTDLLYTCGSMVVGWYKE